MTCCRLVPVQARINSGQAVHRMTWNLSSLNCGMRMFRCGACRNAIAVMLSYRPKEDIQYHNSIQPCGCGSMTRFEEIINLAVFLLQRARKKKILGGGKDVSKVKWEVSNGKS